MLVTHITPSSYYVHLTYSLPLLPWSFSFTHKKGPFIWHALLWLQALYCWIFPALTFKWSHSAPSISLPHYVPPFSLPVISTPSALTTSLLLLTLAFLPSSIANSPYTSTSFNLLSHNIQPSWCPSPTFSAVFSKTVCWKPSHCFQLNVGKRESLIPPLSKDNPNLFSLCSDNYRSVCRQGIVFIWAALLSRYG